MRTQTKPNVTPLLGIAHRYINAGLLVLPADSATKYPTLKTFKSYRKRPPSEKQIETWFSMANGVCILTGAVSGSLEVIDFDQAGRAFEQWCDVVAERDGKLLNRLMVQRSQSGGRHVFYRNELITPSSKTLARTINPISERKDTLIETRGEGSLIMCDPSPGYEVLQGDLTSLPVMSIDERAVLIEAARSFDEVPDKVKEAPPQREQNATNEGTQPGDDFNGRGDVPALLAKHGWRLILGGHNQQWCRPGKTTGCSATLKDGVFYVFSSNADPFEANEAYQPFAVYALLEHGGDFCAASRQLATEGYGRDRNAGVNLDNLLGGFSDATQSKTKPPAEPALPDPGPVPESMLQMPGFVSDMMAHCLDTAPHAATSARRRGFFRLRTVY